MYLSRLDVLDVRNIERARLELRPGVNLVTGANGSGKTSLLEAVYLLGTGRSFRSNRIAPVIRYGAASLTVFGVLQTPEAAGISLGVQRHRSGETMLKIRGEPVRTASELAAVLPVQLINPDSAEIVTGAPARRRRFLDWGTFHVEHGFLQHWKLYRRALEQRNALLRRSQARAEEFEGWEAQLSTHAEGVDGCRRGFLDRLQPMLSRTLEALGGVREVRLGYTPGWDRDSDLRTVLERQRATDRDMGFTRAGPQRADLRLTHEGKPAADALSRGQQKVLSCALLLAQAQLLAEVEGKRSLCLVDDLPAELDKDHRRRLGALLAGMDSQVLITAVEQDLVLPGLADADQPGMFHVEHGRIDAA